MEEREQKGTQENQAYYYNGDDQQLNTAYLSKLFEKRRYLVELDRKDVFVEPGDYIDTCYFIKSGSIIAYELVEGTRRIYDWFGEGMLLFTEYMVFQRPSSYYYEAMERTKMYSIRLPVVRKRLETDMIFGWSFMAQMTRNLLVAQDLMRKGNTHGVRWRVCDFILIEAERIGVRKDSGYVFKIRMSQKLMAELLHINRVTVLREIHNLEALGLIHHNGGHLEISDFEALRDYRDRFI